MKIISMKNLLNSFQWKLTFVTGAVNGFLALPKYENVPVDNK